MSAGLATILYILYLIFLDMFSELYFKNDTDYMKVFIKNQLNVDCVL
jgi:hypothetical protein